MKIGFYDPYFDTLGGGERYTLTLASYWSKKHQVYLFWDEHKIIKEAERRFDLDLSGVKITPNVFATHHLFHKLAVSKQYDLIFFLSDGSIPLSFAKHNILHFQVPFSKIDANPIKLGRYQAIICNSEFTKLNLDPKISSKAKVIYPPVKLFSLDGSIKKEKIILSVGRFASYHHAKKQEVMVSAFKELENKLPGWTLVLAGGLMSSDQTYFNYLDKLTKGHRIELITNISYGKLIELYQKAGVYWHATGFEETDPKFMEHFGISTVEAMSAGAIPLVWAGGGQKEIIREEENGFLWLTMKELIDKTFKVINLKDKDNLRKQGRITSEKYSEGKFFTAYDTLLKSLK